MIFRVPSNLSRSVILWNTSEVKIAYQDPNRFIKALKDKLTEKLHKQKKKIYGYKIRGLQIDPPEWEKSLLRKLYLFEKLSFQIISKTLILSNQCEFCPWHYLNLDTEWKKKEKKKRHILTSFEAKEEVVMWQVLLKLNKFYSVSYQQHKVVKSEFVKLVCTYHSNNHFSYVSVFKSTVELLRA